MPDGKKSVLRLVAAFVLTGWTGLPSLAQHVCDPAEEPGWRVIASSEVVAVGEGAPFREGADWVLERTTTTLPFCNYIDPLGSYSLRSYSLDPVRKSERITLCRGISPSVSVAILPYNGPCPPGL